MKGKLIAIAGTMGVGKTTFAKHLAKRPNFHLLEENFEENPFLTKFYKHPKRWAFHSQLFFLNQKVKVLIKAKDLLKKRHVIVDAPMLQYADGYVAANVHQGNISRGEHILYQDIYSLYSRFCPLEALIVFLSAPFNTIAQRIRNRDRSFEKNLDLDYLRLLYKLDNRWFKMCDKGLKIDTNGLNLVNDEADIKKVVNLVQERLLL